MTVFDPEATTSPGGGTNPGGGDYLRTDLPITVQNPGGGNEHGVEMPGGTPVLGPDGGRTFYDWFTNSVAQRVVRNQDFNNVELSLFSFGLLELLEMASELEEAWAVARRLSRWLWSRFPLAKWSLWQIGI